MNLRHTLYRIKAYFLYKTNLSKRYRKNVWRFKEEDEAYKAIYRVKYSLFDNHRLNIFSDEKVNKIYLNENRKWSNQYDTIYKATGAIYIEPKNSLAFFDNRKLIKETQGHAHKYLTPDLTDYIIFKIGGRKTTVFEKAIHFDGFVSKNLYHLFDDGLNPLLLLIDQGLVTPEMPIIIHEKIANIKFVQYFLQLDPFRKLNWYIQRSDEWIMAQNLYKAVASTRGWLDLYNYLNKTANKNSHRKIFLSRKKHFQRRLSNSDAIEKFLAKSGFETFYAEDLTYEEQVKLFSEVKFLVALHGAGITNLIHSDLSQVWFLEIFTESLVHPHYYWFLEILGIRYYDALIGSSLDINHNFFVSEDRVFDAVTKMLLDGDS